VAKVRNALSTLPWVEQSTAKFDVSRQQVRVTLKDKSAFDLAALNEALKVQDSRYVAEIVKGPTDP
jgi:hypothetical protein